MSQLGEIRRARELGYGVKGKTSYYDKYIWHACIDCGKERWVRLRSGCPCRLRCVRCGNKTGYWKGTRYKEGHIYHGGYVLIRLQPDDFFFPMCQSNGRNRAYGGYVLEHRLVMAKHLGRCLHLWEIVHHKNGIAKDDNRIEGLQLVSDDRHTQITLMETQITRLKQKIIKLEAENRLLRIRQRA